MKILIAAGMEGITGVVNWDHVKPDHPEYARFRKLMTADVNAAIRGAFDGGADEVVVTDGHGRHNNLLIEELDSWARLNAGGPSPLAMVEGMREGVHGAMFVGYHARAGAADAILCHTWSGCLTNVLLNGRPVGETGLNAAVCGYFGALLIMISGDQAVCAEAAELLGPIEVAVVKQACGRTAAECLSPEVAQQRIYEAALQAATRLSRGQAPPPFCPETPLTVSFELDTVEAAEKAALFPGAHRVASRGVEFVAEDALLAYRALHTVVALARR